MDAFLTNITSFPTIIFSIMLVVVTGFWLLTLLGMLDIDILDVDIDIDADNIGGFTAVLINLGLTGVPFTIVFSILSLFAWLFSYYASHYLLFWADAGIIRTLLSLAIAIICLAISLPITAITIRPLRKVFRKLNDQGIEQSLLGATCTIRTSRVDNVFGEAECSVDGLSHIIKVRADCGIFKHGDKAVVIEHDVEKQIYYITTPAQFNQ